MIQTILLDEIERQEARESVMVTYSVTTTGESMLLPMGVSLPALPGMVDSRRPARGGARGDGARGGGGDTLGAVVCRTAAPLGLG